MPPTFAALHAPSPEAVPSTLPLTSSAAAALRSRGNQRQPPTAAGGFPPTHSGCPWIARGCFASHSPQPRGHALHPAAAVPPPCRPAPSRNAHDPIAPYVWPPPFLALGGAPMQPRLLAASASARFSPRARVAATRPCRWGHVRYPPFAGQSRRQRVRDTHPPPLGACLPPIRDAPCMHGDVLPRSCPQPRGRTLHPAAAVPPPCRPAPSRNAHDPIAPYVWPPPFLALGGAPMQPRPLAASASARFSSKARAAATRPCRWNHVRFPPYAGQSRRQRVRNSHPPPLGAFLPPIRGVSFTSRRSMKRRDGKIDCCWL